MSSKKDNKEKEREKEKDKKDKEKEKDKKDAKKEEVKPKDAATNAPSSDAIPPLRTSSRADVQGQISTSGDWSFQIDHSGLIGQKHCDLTFIFENNKEIHQIMVNKPVIDLRCPKLMDASISKPSKKGKKGLAFDVDPEKLRFQEFQRVIYFLYSDQVDFTSLDLPECIRLSKAATLCGITRLQQMCDKHLQEKLSMENIFDMIKFSDTQSVESSKNICLEYALKNNKQFILDARVSELDVKLFQWVIINKERVALIDNWAPVKIEVTTNSTLKDDFHKLYSDMPAADVVFEIEGQKLKAHRALLAHASGKLAELLEKKEPIKLPEKEYANFTADAFQALLRFIYFFDTNIKPLPACQLIHFAKDFQIPHLGAVCEGKIRKGVTVDTVLSILQVAYSSTLDDKQDLVSEIKTNCSAFFVNHLKDINLEPLGSMPAQLGADLLISLQSAVGHRWIAPSATATKSVSDNEESAEASSDTTTPSKEKRKFKRAAREASIASATAATSTEDSTSDKKSEDNKDEKKTEASGEADGKDAKSDEVVNTTSASTVELDSDDKKKRKKKHISDGAEAAAAIAGEKSNVEKPKEEKSKDEKPKDEKKAEDKVVEPTKEEGKKKKKGKDDKAE